MKIALISRKNLFEVPGGDTIQIQNTCRELNMLGVQAKIVLSGEAMDIADCDILHFFNIIRPLDIWPFLNKNAKPYVVTPIYVDYSEYDLVHRRGFEGLVLQIAGKRRSEKVKYLARTIKENRRGTAAAAIFRDHHQMMEQILNGAAAVFPGSNSEYWRMTREMQWHTRCEIVYNGIDHHFWNSFLEKEKVSRSGVICAARIEGIKNQSKLIDACNSENFELELIGLAAPNQQHYYKKCVQKAESNIRFVPQLAQEDLALHYLKAKVHVLPSWFETTGLSSLEAAFMGCNVVVTDKGDTREYFGDWAIYANPDDTKSIREAIHLALERPYDPGFRKEIVQRFTWEQAAKKIANTYQQIMA